MQSKESDNLIIVRLFPGEKVMEKLTQACQKHNVKTGVFLSGLGQLAEFELGFFKEKGNYLPEKFSQAHELLLLTGNVSLQEQGYEFHLHAVLGNAEKKVVGGHFINGKVSVTAEIVILKSQIEIKRKVDQETGLKGLFVD